MRTCAQSDRGVPMPAASARRLHFALHNSQLAPRRRAEAETRRDRSRDNGEALSEFFVVSESNAAPFFSDTGHHYVEGDGAENAMHAFVAAYKHPCGLYAANLYAS